MYVAQIASQPVSPYMAIAQSTIWHLFRIDNSNAGKIDNQILYPNEALQPIQVDMLTRNGGKGKVIKKSK